MNFRLYNRIKKPTRIESFENDYQTFVGGNPLWRGNIIPLHPIFRNYTKIGVRQYNKSKMIQDLWNLTDNQTWIRKDGRTDEWTSITLKSLNGEDQSFLTETELGRGGKNKYKYTKCMDFCSYLREIVESIPTDIYLVRILKLKAGGRIKFPHRRSGVQKKRGHHTMSSADCHER